MGGRVVREPLKSDLHQRAAASLELRDFTSSLVCLDGLENLFVRGEAVELELGKEQHLFAVIPDKGDFEGGPSWGLGITRHFSVRKFAIDQIAKPVEVAMEASGRAKLYDDLHRCIFSVWRGWVVTSGWWLVVFLLVVGWLVGWGELFCCLHTKSENSLIPTH